MKCSKVRENLMDYVAGELPPPEMSDIVRHVGGCDACRAELDKARKASDALVFLAQEESAPALVGAVREKLARRERHVWRPAYAIASVLILLIVAAYGLLSQRHPEKTIVANRPVIHAPSPEAPPQQVTVPPKPEKQVVQQVALNSAPVRQHRRIHHMRAPGRVTEPVINIAVTPRESESYKVPVESEADSTGALTVVRRFDVAGNVTSVTIGQSAPQKTNTDPTEHGLIDAPPSGEQQSRTIHSGGFNV